MGAAQCCTVKKPKSFEHNGGGELKTDISKSNSGIIRANKSTSALINSKIDSAKKLRQLNMSDLSVK